MKKCIKCGSHAFNLYAEEIDQGGFCDVHYWQGRAHRAEALAQPEQEPVAYIRKDQLQKAAQSAMLCEVTPEPRQDRIRIYTTPLKRPWVGLTDEKIAEVAERMEASDPTDSFWREFARAIEAAHNIGVNT